MLTHISNFYFYWPLLILGLGAFAFIFSRAKAKNLRKKTHIASLPNQYGLWVTLWCVIPMVILAFAFSVFGNYWVKSQSYNHVVDIMTMEAKAKNAENITLKEPLILAKANTVNNYAQRIVKSTVDGKGNRLVEGEYLALAHNLARLQKNIYLLQFFALLFTATAFLFWAYKKITPKLKVRAQNEAVYNILLIMASSFAVIVTIGIFISLTWESIHFFTKINILNFLFGTEWNVQSGDKFGAIPLFIGTCLVAATAMAVATPIGLLSAIYMSEYASKRMRSILKPALEILAGIPTVVYGFFAVVTVGPLFKNLFGIRADSILVASIVMGIMIIPYISSLSDDVISAVPKQLRDGALGLGSTRSEMILRVVFPAALPGIIGGILLAISRAIGETMIVVMALSRAPSHKLFPWLTDSTTTVTVTIVDALTGDTEFTSPKVLSAYALALTLFVATLLLNLFALYIVRKYRESYE